MPGPIRKPLAHPVRTQVITPAAVALFERGLRLRAKKDWSSEIAANAFALEVELSMKPWNEDPFDCDDDTPPDWMTGEFERSDYARSHAIRRELEAALRAKRRARREARSAPDQPPPG
jgi:hypothetical protein